MYGIRIRDQAVELLGQGLTHSEISRSLGVSRSTLRSWLVDPQPSARGCPRCDGADLALPEYAALLGYYLGDGCVSRHRGHVTLRVSCDSSYPGIIEDVESLIRRVRPSRKTFRVPAPGVTIVHANWKHWPCLFPQHGPGRKHQRAIVLAPWQCDIVAEFPADFLRGLLHSDGCRAANWATRIVAGERKRYDYPRWMFVNRSDDIIDLCTDTLDALEIAWRRPRIDCIAVSRADDVRRLDSLIGVKR
jgi:hypothetical protein